jgi:glycosyltransferase involved in cell wall biosynthesis
MLEALACGTPVVAFDCPGCVRDIIVSDQQGRLVPPLSPTDLAMSIKAVLGKLPHKDGRSRLPVQFSMERVIDQYEDLIVQTAAT